MRTRRLGATGLRVSELGLGAMSFGEGQTGFFQGIQASDVESASIVDCALDAGVNFIDTADVYGNGASEEFLGRVLQKRRDRIVLATKVGGPMGTDPNARGLSRRHLISACEASLRRLQTTHIDLYQVHWPDAETPIDETVRALDDLIASGKVRYVGASNFGAYQLHQALSVARGLCTNAFVSVQLQYNLLTRDIEDEILPMCATEGIGVLPWSPLASGMLSGKYVRGKTAPEGTRLNQWAQVFDRNDNEQSWNVIDTVRRVAEKIGSTSSQVAIAWLLRRTGVSSVIIGARSSAQLQDNLSAASLALLEEDLEELSRVSIPPPRYPFGKVTRPR